MSESSNNFNHESHIRTVVTETPTGSGSAPAPEQDNNPNKKTSRFTKRQKIGAGIVGGLVVVSAALGGALAANGGNSAKTPPKSIETSAPAHTNTPEAVAPYETVVIPLNATDAEIAAAFIKIENTQFTGNLTQATYDKIQNDSINGVTTTEIGQKIATDDMKAIFDAQYIPNWQQDSNLASIYNYKVNGNATEIYNYTIGQTLTDSVTLTSFETVPGSTPEKRIVDVTMTEHYNDPHDPTNTAKLNGSVSVERLTFVPLNDRYVISQEQLNVK